MTGAEAIVSTMAGWGIEVCFTNPGTSEMHLVHALDKLGSVRCVLGLFEGVVTGAADGYARMAGKPACTLLHLAPGLGNGLANLHNATRARVPLLSIVGQHPSDHLRFPSPLKGDIEAIARPYSKWIRTVRTPQEAGTDTSSAIMAASTAPKGIATLIIPADVSWGGSGVTAVPTALPEPSLPPIESIERVARALRSGLPVAILLGGTALYGEGFTHAGRLAAGTGAKLLAPYAFSRIERGEGRPVVDRVPYTREQAVALFSRFRYLVLVGTDPPVSHFAYPGKPSKLTPDTCEVLTLATPDEDCTKGLEALSDTLSLHSTTPLCEPALRPPLPSGPITLEGLANAIAGLLPEQAVVADESMTSGRGIMNAARGAPPHDWLANTGGSIGIALPLAVGAAVAAKDRRVLCLSADGSGMYTVQALWTMAREGLNISTVVFANRSYSVLCREFRALDAGEPGEIAGQLFDLSQPDLDWVMLSRGLGVPACRANSLGDFCRALKSSFEAPGPSLIEVVL